MPIFDAHCAKCGFTGEIIHLGQGAPPCPQCGARETRTLLAPTRSLTGKTPMSRPSPSDRGCCGDSPARAGCAGPGSCCGKTGI